MMVTRQTQRKRKNAPTRPETETQKPRGKRSRDRDFSESVFIPFLFRSPSRASSHVAEVTKDEVKLFLPTVLPNFIQAIQQTNNIAAEDYKDWAFYAVSQPSIS
jgi:hypothetical protein